MIFGIFIGRGGVYVRIKNLPIYYFTEADNESTFMKTLKKIIKMSMTYQNEASNYYLNSQKVIIENEKQKIKITPIC